MDTRLVLWGEIGTDRKALIAIQLDEEAAKIYIHALPKEKVTKEIQDNLFVEWKNGGEYLFPEESILWEVDANSDTILPENVLVDRPEIILQSQHKWSKKLISSKINQLLADETRLLEEKATNISEYDQSLWDKAKTQWEKIASYQKKNEISWEQTTILKEKINSVFDVLKAVKRINNENEDHANAALVKHFYLRVEELQAKLIYEDQWKYIFEELKKIQGELKTVPLRWNHKRNLYNNLNSIFDDLRKYRMTEVLNKIKGRISQLSKILDGFKDSIARDYENYNMQVEKMQHYTRGKLPADEIKSNFSYIIDKIKDKEIKADGIKQTIAQLKDEIEKEKLQQQDREQQKIKKEQEQANNKAKIKPSNFGNEKIQKQAEEPDKKTDDIKSNADLVKNSGNRTHKKKFGFSKNKEEDHTKDRKEEIKADPDNEMKLHENKEMPSPILEVELEATAESVEKTALPDKEVKKKKEKRAEKVEKSNQAEETINISLVSDNEEDKVKENDEQLSQPEDNNPN